MHAVEARAPFCIKMDTAPRRERHFGFPGGSGCENRVTVAKLNRRLGGLGASRRAFHGGAVHILDENAHRAEARAPFCGGASGGAKRRNRTTVKSV